MTWDAIVDRQGGALIAQGGMVSAARATVIGDPSPPAFDLVVFCAAELGAPPIAPEGVRTLAAPYDDADPVSPAMVRMARWAASEVTLAYRRGQRVLVTCAEGRNRSGLVVALSLHHLFGVSGLDAAKVVRRRRTKARALTNTAFLRYLATIGPLPTARAVPQLIKIARRPR